VSDNHPCESFASAALAYARTLACAAVEVMVEQRTTRISSWESAAVLSAVTLAPQEKISMTVCAYRASGLSGRASGAVATEGAVRKLVDLALKRAGEATPNEYAGPASRYPQVEQGLGLYDRRQPQLTDEAREDVVNSNIEDVRSVSGVEPLGFRYTEQVLHRRVLNSVGLDQFERSSRYTLWAQVKHDGNVIEQSVHSRHFADVASLPLGADLAKQVARYADPQDHEGGPVLLVLEPRAIAKLMAVVTTAFDRRLVEAGKSFLRDGRRVGSEKLHMVDDARQFGGLQSRGFDDRGVPALDLPLIREGVVGALYMTVEDARFHDARPSGHEASTSLWPGNLLLRCGTRSRNMMFPELGEFVILDALVGDDQSWFNIKTGALRLTGHFFSSDSGSEPSYIGVRTIRTTFPELWSGIQEIGNDQQRFGFVDVSTWIVDGLSLE